MPNIPGPVEGPAGLASSRVIFTGTVASGASCTICGSYNLASVVKNSVGNYTITFQKPMTDTSYSMIGSVAGIGFVALWVTYAASVTVQTYNAAQQPADFGNISVVTYGGNLLLTGS